MTLALMNIGAFAVGTVQFFVGIEAFFPRNEVTEIIYKSRDLVGWTAYRIPSTFSSAHAFAGTLVVSLPIVAGTWLQEKTQRLRALLWLAVVVSLLGVFMSAARTHMITAVLLVVVLTLSRELRRGQWALWIVGLATVAYVVGGDARLQRLTTLSDSEVLATRVSGSVNADFFDVIGLYPFGNGLAGGGTSVPHFLQEFARRPVLLENEYARIALEQGMPGLVLWLAFIVWLLGAGWRNRRHWHTARRLQWAVCASLFASAMLGTGLLTSVPQSCVMLLMIGWLTAPPEQISTRYAPRARPAMRLPAPAAAVVGLAAPQ
jgi:hypothetical protein